MQLGYGLGRPGLTDPTGGTIADNASSYETHATGAKDIPLTPAVLPHEPINTTWLIIGAVALIGLLILRR